MQNIVMTSVMLVGALLLFYFGGMYFIACVERKEIEKRDKKNRFRYLFRECECSVLPDNLLFDPDKNYFYFVCNELEREKENAIKLRYAQSKLFSYQGNQYEVGSCLAHNRTRENDSPNGSGREMSERIIRIEAKPVSRVNSGNITIGNITQGSNSVVEINSNTDNRIDALDDGLLDAINTVMYVLEGQNKQTNTVDYCMLHGVLDDLSKGATQPPASDFDLAKEELKELRKAIPALLVEEGISKAFDVVSSILGS